MNMELDQINSSHFDFSDRLFSLDSDDSSYQQHADFFNNLQTQERDYYEDLFTPDSASCSDSTDSSVLIESTPKVFHFENIPAIPNVIHETASSSNDNSIDYDRYGLASLNSSTDILENISLESAINESAHIGTELPPLSSFIDDAHIQKLLEGDTQLPPPIMQEKQESSNHDIIACFNIQNKYDHVRAAELFIQENLSFLATQEPFSSHHKASESWRAYRAMELESARIKSFETPYQVILYDSWKWGEKLLHEFKSDYYGRVTSIAFKFKNQKIGFISVYAPTNVIQNCKRDEVDNTYKATMELTTTEVKKIMKKWKDIDKDIQIIVLGDFQETLSILDRDNIGNYR